MRVTIRRLGREDATPIYAGWFKDEEIRRWITHATPTVDQCRDYIGQALADPTIMLWGIFFDKRHVGNIKAHRLPDQAVLGLLIGDALLRGSGIGPAAIRLATEWCRRHWHVDFVSAGVHPLNLRSIRAFQKCGFGLSPDVPTQLWLEKKL